MSQPFPTSEHELVTGDAVVLDLRLAQLPSRAMSISIDITVQLILLAVLGALVTSASSALDSAAQATLSLLVVVLVIVGYPVAFETLTRGRTLGKLVLGLRVVRDDGGPERFRQALFRGLAEVIEIWLTFGTIAFFVSFFNSRGKRLGDLFGGTVVVRERMPASAGFTATMPPPLAPWAVSADLARVPDDLALTARQVLSRWNELDPVNREQTVAALATAIARYVSPPSPPGTPAPAYLAAILAERRRRATLRLTPSAPPPAAPPQTTPPPTDEPSTSGGFTLPG